MKLGVKELAVIGKTLTAWRTMQISLVFTCTFRPSAGPILEVRMTSQGAGEHFGPGEEIMGYQAGAVYGWYRPG